MAVRDVNFQTLDSQLGLSADSFSSFSGDPDAIAISDSALAGFAGSAASPFLILSTGIAGNVTDPNTSGGQGTDLGSIGATGDIATLRFNIDKPTDADAFNFDFTFLSEEFPEFVGSNFNDFFSVRIDGVEVALDLNGNPITVNNNFFDGSVTTAGTFFDGRTPTLRITAPLSDAQSSFQLQLQIADVGDGVFDSAAFVSNFGFQEAQVVFVDFDAGFLDFKSFASNQTGFNLPGAGLTDAQEDAILTIANDIYSDFLVEFVKEEPVSGEFSTVHVGGVVEDLPDYLEAPDNLFGRAEKIDSGNKDRSDSAFVLSGEITQPITNNPDIPLIAQVLAHEAGHIFGLRHVAGEFELMFPFAGSARTNIGGRMNLAEILPGLGLTAFPFVFQNSFAELANNLGLRSADLVEGESLADQILKFFGFSLSGATSSVADARAVVLDPEGKIVEIVELGDLDSESRVEFVAPAFDQDRVLLIGKSASGGDFDIFLTPDGVNSFAPGSGEESFFSTLSIAVEDLSSGAFTLSQAAPSGALSSIGQVELQTIDIAATLATEGDDVLTGDPVIGDSIAALGGNDSVSGQGGDDTLFGNAGDDTIIGGEGADLLSGGEGDDSIDGGGGADELLGGEGDDTLSGANGDTLIGGEGSDTAVIAFSQNGLTVSEAGANLVIANGDASVEVSSVESFQFTDGALSLAEVLAFLPPPPPPPTPQPAPPVGPTEGADVLVGTDASDFIDALGGDDVVTGLRGFDTLIGGAGADRLIGNGGQDVLIGNGGRDTLLGGGSSDDIRGGGGRDVIRAGGGRDEVKGGGGRDLIDGKGGNDVLSGGGGRDTIIGGRGRDTLTGDRGPDIFQFRTGDNRDVITDFRQGQDKIQILSGANAFDDLTITQVGDDVLIAFSNVRTTVQNQEVGQFAENDFLF